MFGCAAKVNFKGSLSVSFIQIPWIRIVMMPNGYGTVRLSRLLLHPGSVLLSQTQLTPMMTMSSLLLGLAIFRYFSFRTHLDELHVTWAHLKKNQTRLRTNTKTLEDLCSQILETASQAIHDAITPHQVTTLQYLR
nr:hypothetical protein [Tanacetum cinerariifolium]